MPNLNGRRVMDRDDQLECLADSIVFGRRHMGHLVSEFTTDYNAWESHSAGDYRLRFRDVPGDVATLTMSRTEVRSYVGGVGEVIRAES